jgi:GR25 family glycosyltransferase involved in LPS biosynthesis
MPWSRVQVLPALLGFLCACLWLVSRAALDLDIKYRGVYINLASNTERKARLERLLESQKIGHLYQRLDAVNGREVADQYPSQLDPGSIGCWLSHLRALDLARKCPVDMHILEDDVDMGPSFLPLFKSMHRFLDSRRDQWDLVITDSVVVPTIRTYKRFDELRKRFLKTRHIALHSLHDMEFAGVASVLVNHQSAEKYFDLMAGQWKSNKPIDIFLRDLVWAGKIKALVSVPFLTSVSKLSLKSDTRGPVDRSRTALELLRQAFFVDADLGQIASDLKRLTAGTSISKLDAIFLELTKFVLSDEFRPH